jgi:hypothetical protein
MALVNVASRSIRAVAFDRGRLTVVFRSGYVYVYVGVPVSVYERLLAAPSKGRFFNRFIRGRFPAGRAA